MAKYRIALDAYGGDNAPTSVIDGAKEALAKFDDIEITLCGSTEELKAYESDRIKIVDGPDKITNDEAPVMAVRKKINSSLVKAMLEVKEGRCDAVVSAGSTGAILAGGMFRIGRIKGIERPAIATVLPGKNGPVLFIDSGANVDCKPDYLNQFGLMGCAYMKTVMGMEKPRAALANIGAEEEKGNALSKEAYQLMKAQTAYEFAGNIEARDFMLGDIPVIVFDGFDGNLTLKFAEGYTSILLGKIKHEIMSSFITKIGGLLLKPAFKRLKKSMDYREYGGAPLLGVEGVVIKAHGSSDAKAIASGISVARTMIMNGLTDRIKDGLSVLG